MMKRFIYVLALACLIAFIPGAASNPWLNQLVWWYDPTNSSTHASDSNSCAVQTAPCLTWHEIERRLGGPSPPLLKVAAGYIFHLMSSNVGLTDTINFTPLVGNGTIISLEGVLAQVGSSCTLSAATNRNTSASVGTRLTVTASCITATNQLVINSTHSSVAWVLKSNGGSSYTLSQALTPCNTSINSCDRVEVNTWAIGDTISVYTVPKMDVDTVGATNIAYTSGALGFTHVCFDTSTMIVGPFAALWEDCQADGAKVKVLSEWGELESYNHESGSLWFYAHYAASPDVLFKGFVPDAIGGFFQDNADLEGAAFGLGVDLEWGVATEGTYSDIYLGVPGPNGEGILVAPGNQNNLLPGSLVWGPGAFNLMPGATLYFQKTQSTAVFLNGQVAAGGRGYPVWPGNAKDPSVTTPTWCATNTAGTTGVATNCGITSIASNYEAGFGSGCAGHCWFPGGFGLVAWTP